MTLKELSLEIQVGDIINGKYKVEEITSSFAIAYENGEKIRFALITYKHNTHKINTVHRKYYEALKQGGYRHGKRNT